MERFDGKTALVTGAASGIGLALAQRLAREGMKVVLSDIQQTRLEAAVQTIKAAGGEALGAAADVADEASVAALAEQTQATYGAPHVLCANAGVVTYGSLWDQSLDDWRWTLNVNLWGVVHCLRAFVPMMRAHGEEGHVVLTSSSSGLNVGSSSAYGASKAAVVAIAEGMAKEFAGTPLGVSALCPGGVATHIFESETLRPAQFGERGRITPQTAQTMAALQSPDRMDRAAPEMIADTVVEAIRNRQFYVLPMQARLKAGIAKRLQDIQKGLDESPTTSP